MRTILTNTRRKKQTQVVHRGSTVGRLFGAGALALALCAAPAMNQAFAQATTQNGTKSQITDTGITRAVDTELLLDDGVSAHLIDVLTSDGIVTLSGSVDSLLSKDRAVKLAKSIRGVRAVVDQITVKDSGRSDREIRSAVERALLNDPATDSYEIDVSVADGIATLSGDVESWQEKQLTAEVTKSVAGVRGVENNIEWKVAENRLDHEIKAEIDRRLESDIWVNDAFITVSVNDGSVNLSGSVGSAIAKDRAESDAWVAGVSAVDDSQLKVHPAFRDADQRKGPHRAQPSDTEIQAAIKDAFLYDPRVMSFNPTVEVENGIVTLTGKVGDLKAKQAAERDAQNTFGVWRVVNLLKVRPDHASLSDAEIAENVRQTIKADPYLERWKLRVDAVNQKVYLSGIVDSHFEKSRAAGVASGVKGVVEVENNLSVEREPYYYSQWGPYYPTPPYYHTTPGFRYYYDSDQMIKQDIESQYFWSAFVDGGDITVAVEDGVATLNGTVDSQTERAFAIDNAYQAGAIMVDDNLRVTGEPDA